MIITKVDKRYRFISKFDTKTGFYIRSNTFDDKNTMTDTEPFMASMPELLDCGIMNRCKNFQRCKIGCYQGQKQNGANMTFEDFKSIIDECKGKVFQVALGGAGSPDEHEEFERFVKYARDNNVVPNYTTSGIGVTDEIARITKEYCGAVAVSWYGESYTLEAIDKFLKAGCTTNIHFVLSKASIDEAIEILKTNNLPKGISAIIFLLHKPVGKGGPENILGNHARLPEFMKIMAEKHPFKVGFDSCSIPMILSNEADVDEVSIDACEGGRFSAYISADMIMSPCSFDRSNKYGVSLKGSSVHKVWMSKQFDEFRKKLSPCDGCKKSKFCLGKCPIVPEITVCKVHHCSSSKEMKA